jgi:hypothetical protein
MLDNKPFPYGNCFLYKADLKVQEKCPHCGEVSTFELLSKDAQDYRLPDSGLVIGLRYCPNPNCRGLILFEFRHNDLFLYPPSKISMDIKGVSKEMASILNEANICWENQCYTAAAIMIRRALEHLCDENNAKGKNLYERIEALRTKLAIPAEMFEAIHNLRYLGNDATHVESRHYNEVGEYEVRIGLQVAKYIIESLHINVDLLDGLNKLRKDKAT